MQKLWAVAGRIPGTHDIRVRQSLFLFLCLLFFGICGAALGCAVHGAVPPRDTLFLWVFYPSFFGGFFGGILFLYRMPLESEQNRHAVRRKTNGSV